MSHRTLATAVFTLSALSAALSANAHAQSLSQLWSEGKVGLDARYRYEHVDQDNALNNANAQTLRTRITLQSGQWYGLSTLVEADNVSRIGDQSYNDTRNQQGQYSVVADPDGSEINQALVRYDFAQGYAAAGRQRINLDNQRFVGGVAWRQNEQTYDGALAQIKPIDGLTLTYGYIDQVNTIFGPDGQHGFVGNPANIEGHSHLINAQYVVAPALTVTGYRYLLGLDNLANKTQSSATSGLRLTGTLADFSYTAEYASQSEYAGNPKDIDADYYLLEGAYSFKALNNLTLKGGYEVLEGDKDSSQGAFQTPLATKHMFQGWADVFLATPQAGVKDAYFGGSMPLLGGNLQAWYHDFRAETGSSHYGEEFDIAYGHAVPWVKGMSALVKYAHYDADDFGVDTQKLWLQLQYTL
ncbi:alginate export family protein [Atopomonas sediminilitoris]|uniref:alginate export family protein n=1 Tax=Atopomonas sediminilitoris TaxID=2919919 RepID=UPI001F4E3AD3|nr:alginate export family protein [Atopomonas sediminilitoris]MCJ8168863.1 alginate export family protein [Atopomonas sediminilitoris]